MTHVSLPRHFSGTLYRSTRSIPFRGETILGLLVRGMAAGDRGALADLHAALAADMLAAVVATGVTRPEAQELVASAFVEIWNDARRHTDGHVTHWLATIVYRRCFDQHHRPPESVSDLPGHDVTPTVRLASLRATCLQDQLRYPSSPPSWATRVDPRTMCRSVSPPPVERRT